MSFLRLALLALALCWVCHVVYPTPVIDAPWGRIEGVEVAGVGGRRLSGYLGIPFALPPTGPLRWQRPRPHPGPGPGNVFLATELKPACPQELPGIGVYNGISEDCLTLNVFVPLGADSLTSPLPVMIFIHGGGFMLGDAPTYRPTKLVADGGVLVVTIQYRLGTLGFLATGDDLVKGNFGLWDQTLALRWVKDNIRAFGGDPELITVFGESAGSISAGLHTVSPVSRGLFRRAILQSGTPNILSGVEPDNAGSLRLLARELDCERDTSADTVECLRTRSADDIVNATATLTKQSPSRVVFNAHVDGDWLPRDPLQLLLDQDYARESGVGDLDLMVGFNNNEGALLLMSFLIFMGAPTETINDPQVFQGVLDGSVRLANRGQPDETAKKVVEFFYRGADMGTNNSVPAAAVTRMYGDAMFAAPIIEWMRTLAAMPHSGARYMYLFDHYFQFNQQGLAPGSHHGDELLAEFDILQHEDGIAYRLNKTGLTPEEEPLADMFIKALTSFAKTGNPSSSVREVLNADWPEFTRENEAYVALSLTPHVQRDVYRDRIALWLQLLPEIMRAAQRPKEKQSGTASAKDEL